MASKGRSSDVKSSRGLWWIAFIGICSLTILTRFYKIREPDHVCWDETHFGKMGSWYINRTFFFDVHPPLGKMLIGLSGYLTGYDGTFAFDKPGDKYEDVNYVGMRAFCTALGATIVPVSFLIVDEMTDSSITANIFASLLILFDVGLLTLTRYILLDPILLCFMTASVLGAVKISAKRYVDNGMAFRWWLWLFFTGTMLACCIAVKFVGLFVVLLVGLLTISDLWYILGDITRPVSVAVKQLIARTVGLIVWPICLYVFFFYVHLTVLNRSGNGDGFYSSAFQSQLIGNSLHNATMPRMVAYGATITLKNHRTGGGYLHSHFHLYPDGIGAKQQQVTTYTHKDNNNKWLIRRYNDAGPASSSKTEKAVTIVRSGDLIRLEHVPTRRNLHSHKETAPLTKKHYQVTGYGENGTGDTNDIWKVTVVGEADGAPVNAVTGQLRFVHYLQSCALTTTGKQLPKWAYEQQEVTCNPNLRDANALWNVEENVFDKLENVSFEVYAPSFWERFLESHAVMLQGNAGLKPKEGEVTSRPWQWPIDYRGQFFSGANYRIYLLGNPVVWWGNLFFLAVFLVVYATESVRRRRGYISNDTSEIDHAKKLTASAWLFVGWLLHYVPFWAMGRVLYFHHYFPAVIFNSILTGVIMDWLLDLVRRRIVDDYVMRAVYHAIIGTILSSIAYSFYVFMPLSYGMSGPSSAEVNSTMHGLRWLDSWEF